jgi:hypothetical protein
MSENKTIEKTSADIGTLPREELLFLAGIGVRYIQQRDAKNRIASIKIQSIAAMNSDLRMFESETDRLIREHATGQGVML